MEEIWKDIVGYEGVYQVSNLGRVKSLKYGKERFLKHTINRFGYIIYTFCIKNKTYRILGHRLVARAFLIEKKGLEVNHKDGNKLNNNVLNLEWVTHKENMMHARDTNLVNYAKGEKHGNSKLKVSQILEIRKSNLPRKKLAEKYKISIRNVTCILNSETWKHII